jgi:hypothetical protein
MAKAKVSRTYGPIHFEDLDPHRFEDLVRQLIYEYKPWQTIEATGRSGNDGGFDVRAYETIGQSNRPGNEDEDVEEISPMEGNLWMIQAKREKEIGPKRIKEILDDIDAKNAPYGYILAAAANFSKDSYDTFRDELRKKEVMEFYLWGKAEMEDMLHLPKNDHILFAFFGFSLVSRRRSRATQIRQVVINKNKLFRVLGEKPSYRQPVLLRDSKDAKYPYQTSYKDFKERPRWREYNAVEYHPLGLLVRVCEYFAYVDTAKKEYDYTQGASLIYRESDSEEDKKGQQEAKDKVEDYWEHLPRRHRAKFIRHGLVRYDEMVVIDDKGDSWYKFPHIFVDFEGPSGPFAGSVEFLKVGESHIWLEDCKRVKKFPPSFPLPKIGEVHDSKVITLGDQHFRMLTHGEEGFHALFDTDGKYDFLKQRDVVPIENKAEGNTKYYLQITHVERVRVKDYLKGNEHLIRDVEQQIGRKPNPEEFLNVHEFKKTYDFAIDRMKNSKP